MKIIRADTCGTVDAFLRRLSWYGQPPGGTSPPRLCLRVTYVIWHADPARPASFFRSLQAVSPQSLFLRHVHSPWAANCRQSKISCIQQTFLFLHFSAPCILEDSLNQINQPRVVLFSWRFEPAPLFSTQVPARGGSSSARDRLKVGTSLLDIAEATPRSLSVSLGHDHRHYRFSASSAQQIGSAICFFFFLLYPSLFFFIL